MSEPAASNPAPAPSVSPQVRAKAVTAARRSLTRYRVMAIVTGVMLLALCVEMILKYLVHADALVAYLRWIPFAHGWIYVVYLITVMDLWSKMRWSFGRLFQMVIAGVVPVMSFIMEHTLHQAAQAKIDRAAATLEAQPTT